MLTGRSEPSGDPFAKPDGHMHSQTVAGDDQIAGFNARQSVAQTLRRRRNDDVKAFGDLPIAFRIFRPAEQNDRTVDEFGTTFDFSDQMTMIFNAQLFVRQGRTASGVEADHDFSVR